MMRGVRVAKSSNETMETFKKAKKQVDNPGCAQKSSQVITQSRKTFLKMDFPT